MSETLTSIETRLSSVLQDVAGLLSQTDIDSSVRDAVEQFSADTPRYVVADIAGDGAAFDFDLPSGFVYGDSSITQIEYPAGQRVPIVLTADEWDYYRTASTTKLRLTQITPNVGETARVTFTAMHTLDGLDTASVTTIPTWQTQAFVALCAAKAMYRLAARFLHEQESNLGLDSVERATKGDAARRLADAYMRQYQEQVGVSAGEAPGGHIISWPSELAGISRLSGLTHRRRTGI